ncbi:MAG: diacylglycerol kinase [Sulfitobacter sp.]
MSDMPRAKPPRVTGIAHLFAAFGYSLGGLRRLWHETAFRHIVFGLPACALMLVPTGAGLIEYCVLLILFACLIAIEALNTAIECIVDHLAPNWMEFARDAKDLGSLATLCLLFAICVFMAGVFLG